MAGTPRPSHAGQCLSDRFSGNLFIFKTQLNKIRALTKQVGSRRCFGHLILHFFKLPTLREKPVDLAHAPLRPPKG